MSAYFGAAGQALTFLPPAEVDTSVNLLATCMFKWEAGQAHNSQNSIFVAVSTPFTLSLYSTTTSTIRTNRTGLSVAASTATPYTEGTWALAGGMFVNQPVTGNVRTFPYRDGEKGTGNSSAAEVVEEPWTSMALGNTTPPGSFTVWRGWLGEFALWAVNDATTADAVMAALYNGGVYLAPDHAALATIPGVELVRYYRMDEAELLVPSAGGDNLTNIATVTAAADHPPVLHEGGIYIPGPMRLGGPAIAG